MNHENLLNRLDRERSARKQAERILEDKSHELYCINRALELSAEELAMHSERLNRILDTTSSAIVVVDSDGGILHANQSARLLFGEENTARGCAILALFGHAHEVPLARLLLDESRVKKVSEVNMRGANGGEFPAEISAAEIDLDGEQQSVWSFHDLTSRRHLEQELNQAQKMEALGSLASGVAHEINTPTQFVSDNLRFLEDSFCDVFKLLKVVRNAAETLPEDLRETFLATLTAAEEEADLEYIEDEIPSCISQSLEGMERIGQIVAAIKEFSHPGIGEKSAINLNDAIRNTSIVSRNQWKYVSTLELDLADDLPTVSGNAGDINQVVLNLIVNAAHAIEATRPRELGTITLRTQKLDSAVVLDVSDTGCGIPAQNLKRIFDPFFTTKEVGKGTGQGLAITYNIVTNKMGGVITVDTEEGKGTRFRIILPVTDRETGA